MFHYSAYWRTWNRVLLNNFNGQYVEIALTHVNGNWTGVVRETIRIHGTPPAPKDRMQFTLPPDVKQVMQANLGVLLTEKVLTFDYLSKIDWTKFKKENHGGAEFDKIQLDLEDWL